MLHVALQRIIFFKRCKESPHGMLYSALLLEHNRVAEALFDMNPLLNDDELFYQSRKLVVAEIQQITMNEFVPVLLGQEVSNMLNMTTPKGKYFTKYSRKNRPGTFNEAAVSGFTVFENMIPEKINTKAVFKRSISFYTNVNKDTWDPLELMIHRSRDHGISSYPEYKQVCQKYLRLSNEITHIINFQLLETLYG